MKSGETRFFKVGDTYQTRQKITPEWMSQFHDLSGDDNPMHLDDWFAQAHGFRARIVYGNLFGAMLSRLVGAGLPTRHVLILRQTFEFRQPAYVNDEIQLIAEIAAIHEAVRSVQFKLRFISDVGELLCTGQCMIKYL